MSHLFARVESEQVIVSSEIFQRLTQSEIVDFSRATKRWFDEIQVLFYVRHPFGFVHSAAGQRLKQLRSTVDELITSVPVWNAPVKITPWMRVFGSDSLVVKPFVRDLPGANTRDVVDDFLKLIGAPAVLGERIQRVCANEAISMAAAEALDAIVKEMRRSGATPQTQSVTARRKEAIALPGTKLRLPDAALERAAVRATPHVAFLRETFGNPFMSWTLDLDAAAETASVGKAA